MVETCSYISLLQQLNNSRKITIQTFLTLLSDFKYLPHNSKHLSAAFTIQLIKIRIGSVIGSRYYNLSPWQEWSDNTAQLVGSTRSWSADPVHWSMHSAGGADKSATAHPHTVSVVWEAGGGGAVTWSWQWAGGVWQARGAVSGVCC